MMVKEGSQYYNYKYNADGIRIRKNANGITYTYFLDDSGNLIGEKRVGPGVNLRLTYEYDATGILAFGFSDTITGQRGKLYYQKNVQGDIIGINWASGVTACIYDYDAWGNVILQSGDAYVLSLNRILYRGYYQDIETGWYYLQSRYYDPSICRFINADGIDYLDTESLTGLNLYTYCENNPVMYADPTGHMPDWLKWTIGGAVILALGIAVLATGGAAAGVAGFILAGAFKGAVIGAVSGALIGGTIEGISSAIAGEAFWSGFADGAADGFMFGAITGAISGAATNTLKVGKAASMWDKGTFKSSWRSMSNHYQRKVVNAGLSKGNNIIKYTNDAVEFMNRNSRALSMHRGGAGLQHVWTLDPYYFGRGMNGLFTSLGKIISFSYYYGA